MKKVASVLSCAIALALASCKSVPDSAFVSQPTVLVIGYDISASTRGDYTLTHTHIDSIYDCTARKGGGEVYAVLIKSNSVLQSPVQATIAPMPALAPVQGIPPRREKIKRLNAKLMAEYQAQKAHFMQTMETVWQQRPVEQSTDIDGALALIQMLLAENRYRSYSKQVLLITDGEQDLPGSGPAPVKPVTLGAQRIHLVRPHNEALQQAVGKAGQVYLHTTVSDAIQSITI